MSVWLQVIDICTRWYFYLYWRGWWILPPPTAHTWKKYCRLLFWKHRPDMWVPVCVILHWWVFSTTCSFRSRTAPVRGSVRKGQEHNQDRLAGRMDRSPESEPDQTEPAALAAATRACTRGRRLACVWFWCIWFEEDGSVDGLKFCPCKSQFGCRRRCGFGARWCSVTESLFPFCCLSDGRHAALHQADQMIPNNSGWVTVCLHACTCTTCTICNICTICTDIYMQLKGK